MFVTYVFFFLLRRSQKELCYWEVKQFQDVHLIYRYLMILVQSHILLLTGYKKQKKFYIIFSRNYLL